MVRKVYDNPLSVVVNGPTLVPAPPAGTGGHHWTMTGAFVVIWFAFVPGPVPLAFVPATLNVYAVAGASPVTLSDVPVIACDPPPVTVYPAEPPVGAVHVTVAVPVPVADATGVLVGPGTVSIEEEVPDADDPLPLVAVTVNGP